MNSRIIIDSKGGENLTGKGDMLFRSNGSFEPIRLQACYIDSSEMNAIGKMEKEEPQTEPSNEVFEGRYTTWQRPVKQKDTFRDKITNFFS